MHADVESLLPASTPLSPCSHSPRPRLLLVWARKVDPFQMTRRQELSNAASMALPTLAVLLVCINTLQLNSRISFLLVGSALHFPASCAYHVSAALHRLSDRIDNDLRRLDQTYAHIVAFLYVAALAPTNFAGAVLTCCALAWNLLGVFFLWNASTASDGRRWRVLSVSAVMPVAPLAMRGHVNYSLALSLICALGAVPFIPSVNKRVFHGWGHTLFHVSLGMYAYVCALSASTSQTNIHI